MVKFGEMGVKTAVVRVILYKRTVICRIGSLENYPLQRHLHIRVICRIGSLEIAEFDSLISSPVICRIGSLENKM